MKKVFLSFADARLHRSLERIRSQAVLMRAYDEIICADETALESGFVAEFGKYLKPGIRGFGYWCWKPQIIKQALQAMNDGDLLQYTDAGCHLNPKGRRRLDEYFDLTLKSSTGILAFQAVPPDDPRLPTGRVFPDLSEYRWCKGDLLDYLKVRNERSVTHSQTIGAGIIFLKKCPTTIEIVEEWQSVIRANFSHINDDPSASPNIDGFIEHRHDQSIFSIICKKHEVRCASGFEYWFPDLSGIKPDWDALKDFPILAKRDKDMSLVERGIAKIMQYLRFSN